nr:MAG TPA: hypothetical protein [Caudoviricetes sp.]
MKAGDIVRRVTHGGTLVGAYYLVHKAKGNELLASSPAGNKPVVLDKNEFVKIPTFHVEIKIELLQRILNGLKVIEHEPTKLWDKLPPTNEIKVLHLYNRTLNRSLYFEFGNISKIVRTTIVGENRFGQMKQILPLIKIRLKNRIWL